MGGVRLPLDVALCDGIDGEPCCVDCERRTADRPPMGWFMAPEADVYGDCAYRIAPRGQP